MLAKKTRYAMLAMIKLAREYKAGPVPVSRIADSEKMPKRFLEGILLELKNLGFVGSVRGKTGGYFLAQEPAQISLYQIVATFEKPMGMLACVCPEAYRQCEFYKDEEKCKLRKTFKYIHDSTSAVLNNTTLQDLM